MTVGQHALLIRSQGNSVDVMRLEASLTAECVAERSCGLLYLSGKLDIKDTLAAGCRKRLVRILYEGRDYADLLQQIDTDSAMSCRLRTLQKKHSGSTSTSTGMETPRTKSQPSSAFSILAEETADIRCTRCSLEEDSPVDETDQKLATSETTTKEAAKATSDDSCMVFCGPPFSSFSLGYEQTTRVSELEQIPFHPGVSTATWFTQEIYRRLHNTAVEFGDAEGNHRAFVVVDYRDFVLLVEQEITEDLQRDDVDILDAGRTPGTSNRSCTTRTTSWHRDLHHTSAWDSFFRRWCRSDKPWSFSASMDPYIAQCSLNLLHFVGWCVSNGHPIPEVYRRCLSHSDDPLALRKRNMCRKKGTPPNSANRLCGMKGELEDEVVESVQHESETTSTRLEGAFAELEDAAVAAGCFSSWDPQWESLNLAAAQFRSHLRPLGDQNATNANRVTLVDACCGTGTITAVARRTQRFSSIVSCDRSKEFLHRAWWNIQFGEEDPSQVDDHVGTRRETGMHIQNQSFVQVDWTCEKAPANVDGAHASFEDTKDPSGAVPKIKSNTTPPSDPSTTSGTSEHEKIKKRVQADFPTFSNAHVQPGLPDLILPSSNEGADEQIIREQHVLVMANTPWGRRFGGEGDARGVFRGIVERLGHTATALGFFIPPGALELAESLLDVHVCVPLGKPAFLLIGTLKGKLGERDAAQVPK
ncbi:unnamed protein product [Amoebophrya sp. A25]|nr:unnamed protein product [Amoebophrya sp. A25]|eukprot:GSA25T00021512001.1